MRLKKLFIFVLFANLFICSSLLNSVFAAPPTAPGVPTINPKNARLLVQWQDRSNNETSMKVERATSVVGPYVQVSPNLPANSYAWPDTQVVPLTTYYYRVRAANTSGSSVSSVVAGQLVAPPVPPQFYARVAVGSVNLTWEDASNDETNYVVERRSLPSGAYEIIATLPNDTESYSDTTSLANGSYRYRVYGRNMTLAGDPATRQINIQPPPTPAVTVTRSTGGQSPAFNKLNWTSSAPVSGFEIERAVSPKDKEFTVLATVPAEAREYIDNAIEGNKIYFYRLRALNSSTGDSDFTKVFSLQANIEPPYPYIKVPALEQWKVTFTDGSKGHVNVIPDISIPQIIYNVYLRHIDYLNFLPHKGIAKSAIGSFAPCELGANRDAFLIWGGAWFPGKEYEVFGAAMQAEQTAWTEGYKMAQQFIHTMKTVYSAMTKAEFLATPRIQSKAFAGRFVPASAIRINDYWYGYDDFPVTRESVPVFGEQAVPYNVNLKDTVTLYAWDYVYNLLRAQLIANGVPAAYVQAILEMTASDVKSQNISTWLRRLPLPIYSGAWRSDWRYNYCLTRRKTYSQWLN